MAEGDFDQRRAMWRDAVAADASLPAAAFRLAYILSTYMNRETGDAWPSQETLAEHAGWAARYVRTMTKVLVDAGHLRVKITGRAHRYVMILAEKHRNNCSAIEENDTGTTVPLSAETADTGTANKTADTGTTVPLRPEQLFRLTLSKNPLESILSEPPPAKRRPAKPKAEPDGFPSWYAAYPRREARADAVRAYAKAREVASEADLLAGALRYAALKAGSDRQYVKLPATWLNKTCWLDETPTTPPSSGGNPGAMLHASDRRSRAKAFLERGEWASTWGPKRGEPGCLIPEAEWAAFESERRAA